MNSFHHQAIKDLASCFKATAYSVEGIIEAYEHKSLPVFATQFHPEMMATEYCDGRTADFQPIFNFFIRLTKEYAERPQLRNSVDLAELKKYLINTHSV